MVKRLTFLLCLLATTLVCFAPQAYLPHRRAHFRSSGDPSATSLMTSLVEWWKLEDVNGAVNGINLVNNNSATFTAAKVANGVNLVSSSSKFLSVADPAAMTNGANVSWCFWAKETTWATDHAILGKWTYTGDGEFGIQSGALSATAVTIYIATSAGDAGSGCRADYASAFSNGAWSFIVIVFDGSKPTNATRLRVWSNGTELTQSMGAGNVPTTILNGGATFNIGKFGGGLTRYFNGLIDEVGMWNKSLSSDEITYLNAAPRTYSSATGKIE